jgi:hypothetical protein
MATVKCAPSRKRSGCALAAYGPSTISVQSVRSMLMATKQDRAPTARWGPKGLRRTTGP